MTGFLEHLKEQRWDDHRYYHHSRINQSLHLLSATSFIAVDVTHGDAGGGLENGTGSQVLAGIAAELNGTR